MMPEEASQYAESVVTGEAEDIWPTVLDDFINGRLKKSYNGTGLHNLENLPRPHHGLARVPARLPLLFRNHLLAKSFRYRPVKDVIEELRSLSDKLVFFADDNLYGNKIYAKKLFKEMTPLRKKWSCQGDGLIAKDPELLRLAAESGCQWIFICIESISQKNLAQMRKSFNKVDQYKESRRRPGSQARWIIRGTSPSKQG